MIIQHHRTTVFILITVIVAPKTGFFFAFLYIFIYFVKKKTPKYNSDHSSFWFSRSQFFFLNRPLTSSSSCKCRFITLIRVWHVFSKGCYLWLGFSFPRLSNFFPRYDGKEYSLRIIDDKNQMNTNDFIQNAIVLLPNDIASHQLDSVQSE